MSQSLIQISRCRYELSFLNRCSIIGLRALVHLHSELSLQELGLNNDTVAKWTLK